MAQKIIAGQARNLVGEEKETAGEDKVACRKRVKWPATRNWQQTERREQKLQSATHWVQEVRSVR
jgi:hypothetical protein